MIFLWLCLQMPPKAQVKSRKAVALPGAVAADPPAAAAAAPVEVYDSGENTIAIFFRGRGGHARACVDFI